MLEDCIIMLLVNSLLFQSCVLMFVCLTLCCNFIVHLYLHEFLSLHLSPFYSSTSLMVATAVRMFFSYFTRYFVL
jgi:hypothetical protein